MFPVVGVPEEAAEFSEQMGTKFKFWYQDEKMGLALFKEGRPGTGENWAEKIAAELAQLLGIPHAHYELAEWRVKQGVVTKNFVPERGRLIHGNELVGGKVTVGNDNAQVRFYEQRSHIASRVFQFLKLNADSVSPPQGFEPFDGVNSALGVFVGYLLFDVWISNQDRHAENWGEIRTESGIYLAPSYDHGSSLGRQETDERRMVMMTTKDMGSSIAAYVKRAKSSMYPNASADVKAKSYLGIELFEIACRIDAAAGLAWRTRLEAISKECVRDVIDRIPTNHMSDIAKNFTEKLLELNIARLLQLNISK